MNDQTLKNANIMIVDDAEANIAMLEGFLMLQGYNNILTVSDPRNVVPLVETFDPDLIFLDLLMPHLTGFEVMEKIREVYPPNRYLPILVLTADITDEAKMNALSGGAKDFLTKPLNLVEVELRMKNLLETRFLYQQLENQNSILEEKVKARTFELVEKNRELEVAKDKAETSDKLKTAFLHSISHEVRTPLNGILGFGELLTDPEILEDDKNAYLQLLKFSSDRLIKTINDYLDMAKLVSGSMNVYPKQFSLTDLLEELSFYYQNLCIDKGLTLTFDIPGVNDDTMLQTDREILYKLLSHILDNAVKFTPRGDIVFDFTHKPGIIEFSVKDTGIGIKDELRTDIFNIFTQGEMGNTRNYEGSGLGLSLAKRMADLLGGTLSFESEHGLGSTFRVTLPTGMSATAGHDGRLAGPKSRPAEKPVILIVEDENLNYVYLEAILKRYASKVLLANNGKLAVDLCHENPDISLVFMDIRMPEMDGIDATRIIKSFRKDLPVIALTAYAIDNDERDAIEAGCDDYLLKPYNHAALKKMLLKYGVINQ